MEQATRFDKISPLVIISTIAHIYKEDGDINAYLDNIYFEDKDTTLRPVYYVGRSPIINPLGIYYIRSKWTEKEGV